MQQSVSYTHLFEKDGVGLYK
ncbi:hypothetical protein A5875_001214, partial [Enterococcus sp. 3H8_DIV0648]